MGVSYTLPDGQLAMRAFDNGAGHACSESYAVFNVQCVPFGYILFLFYYLRDAVIANSSA